MFYEQLSYLFCSVSSVSSGIPVASRRVMARHRMRRRSAMIIGTRITIAITLLIRTFSTYTKPISIALNPRRIISAGSIGLLKIIQVKIKYKRITCCSSYLTIVTRV